MKFGKRNEKKSKKKKPNSINGRADKSHKHLQIADMAAQMFWLEGNIFDNILTSSQPEMYYLEKRKNKKTKHNELTEPKCLHSYEYETTFHLKTTHEAFSKVQTLSSFSAGLVANRWPALGNIPKKKTLLKSIFSFHNVF